MIDLAEAKKWLRIDGDYDNSTIEMLIVAAKEYLANAGVAEKADSKLYDLAVLVLVTHWYENRSAVITGSISKEVEYSLRSILVQLANIPSTEGSTTT